MRAKEKSLDGAPSDVCKWQGNEDIGRSAVFKEVKRDPGWILHVAEQQGRPSAHTSHSRLFRILFPLRGRGHRLTSPREAA